MKDYKNLFLKILKNGGLFFILIVFTFYFVFKDMDLKTVINTISDVKVFYLFIAAVSMCIFMLCEAINFRRNLSVFGYKTNLLKCINYSINGFFFSSITPSASGGQPMQVYQMYKDDVKISHATLVLFVEFIFFQTVTIMYALIGFVSQRSLLLGNINSLMVLFVVGVGCNLFMLMLIISVLFYSDGVRNILNVLVKFLHFCKFKKADMIKEKVESVIDADEVEEQAAKMKKGEYDLEDFLKNLKQIKKLGPLDKFLKLLHQARQIGLNNINIDPKDMAHVEAIVLSMTKYERKHPEVLKASRKRRIAEGSGRTVEEVNHLLKQFETMQKMMKQMASGNFKMPF